VLVVGSGGSAVVKACERQGSRWVSVLGTMYGHVGYAGVAPPGAKREGDGRTPSGVYPLGFGFGVDPNPGLARTWRRVGPEDVWVDDPGSQLYNTWQELPANGRWDSAESLYTRRSYALAQVVEYNTARVPGRGSGIFLHVDHASPTTGCVSVPRSQLVRVFRWERAGVVIAIR
jgi:L,D-peptidoglycan transpeptidase YkuD (ErfK/YbiS/YcfS/YnhG family)